MYPGRPLYSVAHTDNASEKIAAFDIEAGQAYNRVLSILEYDPVEALNGRPMFEGSDTYVLILMDAPGGPLGIEYHVNETEKHLLILDVQHPIPIQYV